ncbi:IclR family transcriptional regulator [Bradyrhizobium viridifuturi]|uniref:IclR family transcriptional regulator n=1 Tax=Bradyrhizobium viridifuturi TaxID=1654716 RepID=UPI00067E7BF5|nr:IclR family transcriptional regulator [Bradyrhizobium viridifuturi]
MKVEDRRGIKAVEVAGHILDHLARAQAPVALRELAAAGHMSPGKIHRYLSSFLVTGLARQDPDTRQYALGPLAVKLGLAALNSYQPLRDAIALQRELRDRIDETLVLSVWGAQGPTIVHIEESSQPIIMTMRIGAVLPILATATGLAFASFLPRHFSEPLIRTELAAVGGLNLFARDPAAIDRLITEVRDQGYAYNEGHLMQGVSAAAFPLFDRTATLVGVIAVMGRQERVNPRDGAQMIACLKKETRNFSH